MFIRNRAVGYVITIGCFLILLGCVVIYGWLIRSDEIIQLNHHLSPMQFNTAICFVVAGLSLIRLQTSQKEYFFSSILLLLSVISLGQYLFDINLGIDELLIKAHMSAATLYPGRMAPNTALSFTILALVIATIDLKKIFINFNIIGLLFVVSIGFIAILGYFTPLTTNFGFGQWIKMALHTAIGLIVISIGLLYYLTDKNHLGLNYLLPFFVTFFLLNLTFFSWQTIKNRQESHLSLLVSENLNSISSSIKTHMIDRATAFERIAHRWLSQPQGTSKEVWQKDVAHYIEDQPGYIAIEWVDRDFIIRWVEANSLNTQTIGFDLSKDKNRHFLLEQSFKQKHIVLSKQLNLIQGQKGIIFSSPLLDGQRFDGFIVGVFNSKQLFKHFLTSFRLKDFYFTISDGQEIMFTNAINLTDINQKLLAKWQKTQDIQLYGQKWRIQLAPKLNFYHEIISSTLPFLALFLGLLISMMAGILTYSLFRVKLFQEQVRDANERLRGIIEHSTDYIAAIDLNQRFLVFNQAYKTEIYRLLHLNISPNMSFYQLASSMSTHNFNKSIQLWQKALSGQTFSVIEHFQDKRFTNLYYEIHYNPIFNAQNKIIGASHIATNISKRIENEQSIKQSQQKLELLVRDLEQKNKLLDLLRKFSTLINSFDNLNDITEAMCFYMTKMFPKIAGTFFTPNDSSTELKMVVSWNELLINHKTIQADECLALAQSQIYIVNNQHNNILCKHIESFNKKPYGYLCMPLLLKNNLLGLIYLEFDHAITEDEINAIQMVCKKITLVLYNLNLKASLKFQAIHDSLTGLYNRRYIDEFLEQQINQAERYDKHFAVLLIDIDFFKKINDTYGHAAGDNVLTQLSSILKTSFRASDVVGRWGGEEFIIIFQESNAHITYEKALKLKTTVENSVVTLGKQFISFTISIGISYFIKEDNRDSIVKRVDKALYQAKKNGRNCIVNFNQPNDYLQQAPE